MTSSESSLIVLYIKVFSSVKKVEELWYTRDEGVVQIGELVLELPEVGRTTRDREVEVFFDFSHTEIQVYSRLLCFLILWTMNGRSMYVPSKVNFMCRIKLLIYLKA